MSATITKSLLYPLSDSWTLWAHLPHIGDWKSIHSYKKIHTFSTMMEAIALTEYIKTELIENCMLFLMREGVAPMWEDKKNRDGGYFSYIVKNSAVLETWKKTLYLIIGEQLHVSSTEAKEKDKHSAKAFHDCIVGFTISPKKSFCVLKIWMTNHLHQDPKVISIETGLSSEGCIFKEHKPEW